MNPFGQHIIKQLVDWQRGCLKMDAGQVDQMQLWPNFPIILVLFLSAAKGQRPKNYLSFCCWFSSCIFHLKNLCNLSLSLCIFIIFLSFCYCLSPYLSISLLYMSTYLPMSIYLHQHTYLSISRHLPTYDYLPTYVNLPTPTNLHQHT